MADRQSISNFRLWNEEMGVKYSPDDYHERSFFPIKFVEKLRIKTILRLLNARKNDIILEIGCGAGNLMQAFDQGWVIGIDLSSALLKIAKGKRFLTRYDLAQSYGEAMPFKDLVFDKIYCSEVLEHVRDPKDICREADRVLKKDGTFVVSVPNEPFINLIKNIIYFLRIDKILNRIAKYKFSRDMTEEWHLHSFSLVYLKKSIADIFVIDKVQYIPTILFPVRIVVSCGKKGG